MAAAPSGEPHGVDRAQVLGAAVLFGSTGTAQALGPRIDPLLVGSGRIVVGGALLLLLALAGSALTGLGAHRGALAIAGVAVALYQLTFFPAVRDTGVAVGAIVTIGSAPVFAGLLEWVVEGTRPTRRWALATALAATGVAVLTLAASAGSTHLSARGILLALGAAGGYATYAVIARRLLRRGCRPVGVMGAAFAIGAMLLAPVLVLDGGRALLDPPALAVVTYLGVFPTAVAYVLYARGLRTLTAADAATIGLAEPVTASFLGVLVVGERFAALSALGSLLVLGGVAVVVAPRVARRTRREPGADPGPAEIARRGSRRRVRPRA